MNFLNFNTFQFNFFSRVTLGSTGFRSSFNAFIFSFVNKDNLAPFKSPVYRYSANAVYTSVNYGPVFGGGNDIRIVNKANANTDSYTNFGYTYRPPSGYTYNTDKVKNLLAGTYKFTPNEVETVMFSRGNAGGRRPPTFFTRGTASPLLKSNVGERRSPWQGLNMSEVQ